MTASAFMAGERVNYLSVALRARGAIKTLKSLMSMQQGLLALPNPELQEDLGSVINSLRATASPDSGHAKLSLEIQYSRFEEVQTLDEVIRSFTDKHVLSRLESLLKGGCNEDDMRTAIRLFSAIERQALYHYNDPSWAPGL